MPDLKVTVEKMILAGDYVTVHMSFTGHFTGRFGQTQGKGQRSPSSLLTSSRSRTAASPTIGTSRTI